MQSPEWKSPPLRASCPADLQIWQLIGCLRGLLIVTEVPSKAAGLEEPQTQSSDTQGMQEKHCRCLRRSGFCRQVSSMSLDKLSDLSVPHLLSSEQPSQIKPLMLWMHSYSKAKNGASQWNWSSFSPDGIVNKAVTICQDKMEQKTEAKRSFNFQMRFKDCIKPSQPLLLCTHFPGSPTAHTVLSSAASVPYLVETSISALKSQLNEGVNYLRLSQANPLTQVMRSWKKQAGF